MNRSKEEYGLVVEAIRREYKTNPIFSSPPNSETLLGMAAATGSWRQRGKPGSFIQFDPAKYPELKEIDLKTLKKILNNLAVNQSVLKNYSPGKYPPSERPMTIPAFIQNDPSRFFLLIYDTFDHWYAIFKVKQHRKIEDLNSFNLNNVYEVVQAISSKFQIQPNSRIFIHPCSAALVSQNGINSRLDALEYLKDDHVVLSFHAQEVSSRGIEVYIDVDNFLKFESEITKLCEKPISSSPQPQIALPPNTNWEDITIQFHNGHDVTITAKSQKLNSNFEKMGFKDNKTRNPNKMWEFLETLSQNDSSISWRESEANTSVPKTKERLAKTLKQFFGIDSDPFLPYSKQSGYTIKIKLISS